jgi:phenylalanyl-tRNA synthetase alpha chain
LVEISQNEARVLKTLIDSGGRTNFEDLAKKSGLADSAVARAVLNLSQNQLVKEKVDKKTELSLTDEGRTFARVGLPERIILLEVKNRGGRMSLKEALQHSKLAEKYGSIATGWISRKNWGTVEKSGSDLVIVARSEAPVDDDEEILARLKSDILILEELPPVLKEAALRLTKRNLVHSKVRNDREVEITDTGRSEGTSAQSISEVTSLTGSMIVSGEWEKVKLRSYNVASAVPRSYPGKYHPYLRFLRMVKRKLVALGFREAVGPLVETAFINCDCLYMPQDHPAREIHDLYYLKDPSRASLEEYGSLVDRVAQTHENGWKTGSTGWRYNFSRDEASKLILRSHGTALSVRTMLSKDLQIPGKYFAIARCFRPDMLDKTHLTEFNQAEGIVLDPSLSLRNLLGILEMFAKEVAGADRVRFKPDYFPFTEPSVELQAYREGYGWMEFGGSGIFRPEVTEPLGVKVPVLAWGLGIDRLYMMSRRIQDIRQLFTSDLDWIREQTVG